MNYRTSKYIKNSIIYVLSFLLIMGILPPLPTLAANANTSANDKMVQPPSKQLPNLNVEPNHWTVVSKAVYGDVYEGDDPEMDEALSKLASLNRHQFRGFSTFSIQEAPAQSATLTQEQVTSLIFDGAEVADVYWIDYLIRKTGNDPLQMWKKHEEDKITWEQLEEQYTSNIDQSSTVTNEVYTQNNTDPNLSKLNAVSIASNSEVDTDTKIETAFDSLLREQALTSKINAQYADTSGTKEEVTPGIGNLIWQDQQIHLSGRDNLDLNIGVTYDSSEASAYYKGHTPRGGATLYKGNLDTSYYNLGVGWQFQFPYVSDVGTSKPTYHDADGGTTGIDFETNLMGSPSERTKLISETGISNAQGRDRHFSQESVSSFSNGQVSSYYYMEYADKRREYFSDKGRIIGIVDRYGNQITFNYQPAETYRSDKAELLSSITDTIGRKIVFQYDNTLNQENFQGENVTLIVYDPTGREVQRVVYTKSRMALSAQGYSDGYAPLLSKITNTEEDVKTFDYDMQAGQFRYYRTKGYASQPFALLKTVNYPRSSTQYAYALGAHDFGKKGDSTEYRVVSREDQLQTASGSVTAGYNHIDYTYNGDYAAYFGTPESEQAYRYSHTSTTSDHQSTTYVFNRMNQLLSTEISGDGIKKTTENEEFDPLFNLKPIRVKTTATDANGTNIYYANTSYNNWGGVQSQTDNMPSEEFNQSDMRTKYTVNYTYDDKYKQITSKTWYQNNNTQLSEQYAYTSSGRLQSATNAAGETTTYTYESSPANANANQIQRITEKKKVREGISTNVSTTLGSEYGYAYPTEQTTTSTNVGKNTKTIRQTMKYDSGTGLLTEQTDSDGNKTVTSYDNIGRPIKITQPSMTNLDGTTYAVEDQFTYTNRSFSTEADSTNAGILTLRVDSLRQYTNKATGAVTILNRQSAYYDGLGFMRVSETYNENNGWTRSQYHPDNQGRTVYAVDPLGNTQTAVYDAWGQQKEYTDEQGNLYIADVQLTQHKTNQFAIAASDAAAYHANKDNLNIRLNATEQTFDDYGNKVKVVAFKDGAASHNEPLQESYTYDLVGNVLSYTDPNGNRNSNGVTTSYTYDALNRLTLVQDAMDQSSRYTYDGLGGLSSVIISDNSGKSENLYTKNYNELGQLTGKTSTSGKQTSLTYDERGLNNQQTDRKGTVTTYQYDERGQRTSALLQGKDGTTLQTKSIFGSDGNLLSNRHELYLNGTKTATQTSTIDKLDRITKLTSSANGYEASLNVNYDPLDRIQRQTNQLAGSSFITQYGYNKSRLIQIQTDGSSTRTTAATANVQYDYTPLGQVKQITFPTLSDGSVLKETMNYDPLNRLTDLTNTRGGTTLSLYRYTYDANGNILSVQEQQQGSDAKTSNYAYDKLDRLTGVKRADGSESTYTYDLRGNRKVLTDTQTLPSTKSGSYVYDLQNTLTSVSNDNGKTTLDYLPDGLRFKKTTGDKVTQYSYNGADQVIGDKTSNGTVSSYVRGDRVLVKKDLTNQKDYYYLYNGHGDVVQMIGTDGSVVNSYQYDEWGSLTQQKETVSNEFKYAGETYDAETGLYYLKARYYDPAQGRFLNEDTVEGQVDSPLSLNIYTYVSNNPLRYVDPTGNKEFEIAPDGLNNSFLPSSVVELTSPSYWEQVRKRASSVKSKIKRLNIFSEIAEVVVKEGVKDDVSNYVWNKLTSTQRGEFIEEVLAQYDYDDYYQIGREYNGYFPVIDFVSNDGEVVSLKTIDPRSYSSSGSLSKLSDDLKELARTKILIDGAEVPMSKRTLDIRVPQGYADSIDLKGLLQKAGKITVKVEEF